MKLSQDAWLGTGILFTLIVVTVLATLQSSSQEVIPYLSTSSAPDGTLALNLWLEELGYAPVATSTQAFEPTAAVKTILVIEPLVPITAAEWKVLNDWINQGGTLVLAGTNDVSFTAMQNFDFQISYLPERANELLMTAPLLTSPIQTMPINLDTDFGLRSQRTDYLPLLVTKTHPVLVSFEQGKGTVILSSTPVLFSNIALKDDGIASVILNIFANIQTGTVWFDEWHHGFQSEQIVGPNKWLQNTSGGRAVLFFVFAIFIALLLQGRSFGRPIPLKHEIKRRMPMEHITAIANLSRKAGHRSDIAKQYRQRLKRQLGLRFRLDPILKDEEYVEILAGYNPALEKDELSQVLKGLAQKNISESELLALSAKAAKWMNE